MGKSLRTEDETAGGFAAFYRGVYADDHRHPANLALHMAGTFAGIGLIGAIIAGMVSPWWLPAFPVVHAAPGLIGHRLFDRNPSIGDLRVVNGAYPGLWFMAANHIMAATMLWRLATLRGLPLNPVGTYRTKISIGEGFFASCVIVCPVPSLRCRTSQTER